jgi:hypothetical protein
MSKRSIADQVLVTLHKRAVAEQVREAKLDARERERQEVRDRGIPMQRSAS